MYRSQIRGILVLPSPDPNAFLVLALGLRKIQFFLVVHDFLAGSLLGFWFFISIRFLVAGHPFSAQPACEALLRPFPLRFPLVDLSRSPASVRHVFGLSYHVELLTAPR
jgi:hypothetical protein